MKAVVDTEWNGLENPDKCWAVVFRDVDNPGDVYVFEHPYINPQPLIDFSHTISQWIGHNFIDFDRSQLLRLFPGMVIPEDRVLDTLVVSRTINYNIEGGHSLEAWGPRLSKKMLDGTEKSCYNRGLTASDTASIPKEISSSSYLDTLEEILKVDEKVKINDFSVYTRELLVRCISDTALNLGLYRHLLKYIERKEFAGPIKTEHEVAFLCRVLHETGFAFDEKAAKELYEDVSGRLNDLDAELLVAFPPKRVLKDKITARGTQSGAIHSVDFRRLLVAGYAEPDIVAGQTYPIFVEEEFNPNSPKQIIERLNEAGWKPTEKTKGHIKELRKRQDRDPEKIKKYEIYGWALSEENLKTLPDTAPPAAKRLVERLMLASRVRRLDEWFSALGEDGRIHGRFNHIGAWTHRKSHSNPNMANIPKVNEGDADTEVIKLANNINRKMRRFWMATVGRRLLGVDADGIQMRIFAHYVNDKRLIEALINGKKEDETDIHSLHRRALAPACKSRDDAKTFIYAWLLGAGTAKVAEILRCSLGEAKAAIDQFIEFYPGLRELKKNRIPADAKQGYFVGLDGRLVVCDNEHLVLAGYLQNGESIIMKRASVSWYNRLVRKEKLPLWFVDDVHDEWQSETEDDNDLAKYICDVQGQSIVDQGDQLELNCPLAATTSMSLDGFVVSKKAEENTFVGGYNWYVTH